MVTDSKIGQKFGKIILGANNTGAKVLLEHRLIFPKGYKTSGFILFKQTK